MVLWLLMGREVLMGQQYLEGLRYLTDLMCHLVLQHHWVPDYLMDLLYRMDHLDHSGLEALLHLWVR